MNCPQSHCPQSHCTRPNCARQLIAAFVADSLADSEVERLQEHLETCESCVSELAQGVAEPSFWGDAKEFLASSPASIEDPDDRNPLSRVGCTEDAVTENGAIDLERLGWLDPTDDPRMMGRFAGYEISGIVGRGGMGIVLKGWDVSLSRFVAIKILGPDYAWQSAARSRFAREAQATAAVVHDNIVPIFSVDQWKELPFLVMPYIKGESLQHRIDRKAPLSVEDILRISLQISRGLAAAHDQGLIHRDIKPANILMPQSVSRIMITDFGLARSADDASLTRSGVLAGTPQYMSPEQAAGDPVDPRTDLFSLGSVMYAMACGRPPFRAETPYGVLRKLTDEPHRPVTENRPDLPKWLSDIIDQCLEKRADDRFQSSQELADHLEDCLAHIRQPSTAMLPKINLTSRRRKRLRWAIGLTALIVLLGAVVYLMPGLSPAKQGDGPVPPVELNTPDDSAWAPWSYDEASFDQIESELGDLKRELKSPLLFD